MIPRLLHFVWIGGLMPDWARANIEAFERLNPEFAVQVHNESALLSAYRARYAECQALASKADLIRYSVLERYGGWYFDVDFVPYRPLADIERAYGLDGQRLFVSQQQHQRNAANIVTNSVLAAAPGCAAFDAIREYVLETPWNHITTYGPRMMVNLVEKRADLFVQATAPWFFPAPAGRAGWLASTPSPATEFCSETGGQKPFAMHLWAGAAKESGTYPVQESSLLTIGNGPRRVSLTASVRMYREQLDRPFHGLVAGLNALGFAVDLRSHDDADLCSLADAVFVWNGLKTTSLVARQRARKAGVPCFQMEHGFFRRRTYNQVDHQGILHWSSWAKNVKTPAPPEGVERLMQFYPDLKPVQVRQDGYVLVLGQLAGDTQMLESEITGPAPLQRLVSRSLSNGCKAYFRPHPLSKLRSHPKAKVLPTLDQGVTSLRDRRAYRRTQQGLGLPEALAKSRFAVAINSNALNEALALGVPCLAFGPHLGINAGVIHPTSAATLREDLREMQRGWCPEQTAVENYLQWLAARQWSGDDLADPAVLGPILERAGIVVDAEVACV